MTELETQLATHSTMKKLNFSPLLLCWQVEDANFSLNHPNQYFIESQKILGGGKDLKREVETQQRSQEGAAARGAREAAANASQGLAEMTEDLDSFFQDGWFLTIIYVEINICLH